MALARGQQWRERVGGGIVTVEAPVDGQEGCWTFRRPDGSTFEGRPENIVGAYEEVDDVRRDGVNDTERRFGANESPA